MKNVIFISPNFPENYWHFCHELKENGMNVLGIGDCPYDDLRPELQESLQTDIDRLVELKKEIMGTVKAVEDVELQALLEKRYLCFLSWEKIAVDMHSSIQHIYRMHDTALAAVEEILPVSVT